VIKALAQTKGIKLYSEGGATGEYVKLKPSARRSTTSTAGWP